MGAKQWVRIHLSDVVRRYGYELLPSDRVSESQRSVADGSSLSGCPLSPEAAEHLKFDNPRLTELTERYRAFDSDVTTPLVWTESYLRPEGMTHFRGDNGWVWQVRGTNAYIVAYALTFYYLRSIDSLRLLDKMTEDNSFGNFTFSFQGRTVSRDLLDSTAEIYFLHRHLGIGRTPIRILDIGAGYGRLAHRMASSIPSVEKYLCTDAVAVSTFVCEYYLKGIGAHQGRA